MSRELYKVTDGSWTLEITPDGRLTDTYGAKLQRRNWYIVASGCDLPSYDEGERNDTIIQSENGSRIAFIKRRFLQHINVCPKCGTVL